MDVSSTLVYLVDMFSTTTTTMTSWTEEEGLVNDDDDLAVTGTVIQFISTSSTTTPAPPGPNYNIIHDIYFFSMAVIIPIGLLCNIFSFAVFAASPTLRRTTTGHYLMALSAADFLFLIGELLRWMNTEPRSYSFHQQRFMHESKAACWIVYTLRYSAKLVSAWVTVVITLERFITIRFPLKVARISTPFRAKVIIAVITVIGGVLGSYPFWTLTIKDYKGTPYCLLADKDAYENWSMVVLRFGTLLVPSLIIIVLTGLIIYNLTRASTRRRNTLEGQKVKAASSVERQLTVMLLAVAITFIILRLPYTVSYYLNHHKKNLWKPLGKWLSYRIFAAWKITDIFATANYCANFFLYCLCGSAFRRQLRISFGCEKAIKQRHASTMRTRSSYAPSSDVSRSPMGSTNGLNQNIANGLSQNSIKTHSFTNNNSSTI